MLSPSMEPIPPITIIYYKCVHYARQKRLIDLREGVLGSTDGMQKVSGDKHVSRVQYIAM